MSSKFATAENFSLLVAVLGLFLLMISVQSVSFEPLMKSCIVGIVS